MDTKIASIGELPTFMERFSKVLVEIGKADLLLCFVDKGEIPLSIIEKIENIPPNMPFRILVEPSFEEVAHLI